MYERIFLFFEKLVDEIELGSDQRNYTFMRIDINLRLRVRGIYYEQKRQYILYF